MMMKDADMEALCQQYLGEIEENHEKSQSRQPVSWP
jgi:hypothetical protein